jgi:hypothetical protein
LSRDAVRAAVLEVARAALRWDGPLPEGDLSEHLDSVQRLTLVVALEDHFDLAFTPADDAEVRTLEQVVDAILARTAEARRG